MRIITAACTVLLPVATVLSQSFAELDLSGDSFAGAERASISAADFDDDGDIDYLVAGLGSDGRAATELYLNDGAVRFAR